MMALIKIQVTRIRCDPMFTSKFNGKNARSFFPAMRINLALEHILTKWGYKDCISTINDGKESSLSFYSTEGSLGGVLPKRELFPARTHCILRRSFEFFNVLFPITMPTTTYIVCSLSSFLRRARHTLKDFLKPLRGSIKSTGQRTGRSKSSEASRRSAKSSTTRKCLPHRTRKT